MESFRLDVFCAVDADSPLEIALFHAPSLDEAVPVAAQYLAETINANPGLAPQEMFAGHLWSTTTGRAIYQATLSAHNDLMSALTAHDLEVSDG